jgi:hypothetical protein
MSSIFTLNRQTPTQRGTGLPFYSQLRYQERFNEVTDNSPDGYWQTPQNRLPSFQVWNPDDLVSMKIVGLDGSELPVDISYLKKVSVTGDSNYEIYYVLNLENQFFLDCGLYYIELNFGVYSWFSEVFKVGGVCAFGFGISYEILSINMDESANVLFTINTGLSAAVGFINSVNSSPNFVQSFTAVLPLGDNLVGLSMQTDYCGTYAQSYTIENLGDGILVFTKLAQ